MSLSDGDLTAYFDRIGYGGNPRPDRETLATLVAAHTGSIPFENLNPLLGLPVPLDPESLVRKLVHQRRGGYCYEQNGIFSHVLETIGFVFTRSQRGCCGCWMKMRSHRARISCCSSICRRGRCWPMSASAERCARECST